MDAKSTNMLNKEFSERIQFYNNYWQSILSQRHNFFKLISFYFKYISLNEFSLSKNQTLF